MSTSIRRRVVAVAVALIAAAAAAVAPITPPASAAPPLQHAVMQQVLDALRIQGSAPGAGITFGAVDGHDDATLASGTRNILTREPIESTDTLRVGSNTKMFVAAVVLQLVGEGLLDLDVPIDQYRPGALRYPADTVPGDPAAYDGRTVTLRQLLQHTGGVPDYADILYVINPLHLLLPPQPEHLVRYGVRNGPASLPGTGFRYSNTGYALIGMIVEAVTGRSIRTEIAERIVGPLGLTDTFFAEPGQRALPGEHVRGYLTALVPLDMTNLEPGVYGTAGALVSSPDDMNTFLAALLAGEVLPPALLAEMQAEVPYLTGGYGLGLVRIPLSCGDAFGHSGFVSGYQTTALALPGGRRAFFTLNTSLALNLVPPTTSATALDLFELALC